MTDGYMPTKPNIGTDEEFLAACHKEPEKLTDRELDIVGSTHPQWAAEMRLSRERARAKAFGARRQDEEREAARAKPAAQPAATHPVTCQALYGDHADTYRQWLKALDAPTDEPIQLDIDEFLNGKIAPLSATPLILTTMLWGFTQGMNQKNTQRNERLDTLERERAELQSELALAVERIRQLEERPAGLAYRGVWRAGERYLKGDVTTRGGSMWVCLVQSTRDMPGDGTGCKDWQLCCKRGSDGKDAPQAQV
jgi:hypothetical protein